jgi:hypothetical protein
MPDPLRLQPWCALTRGVNPGEGRKALGLGPQRGRESGQLRFLGLFLYRMLFNATIERDSPV